MRLFIITFKGHYLPGTAVVRAKTAAHALELLQDRVKDQFPILINAEVTEILNTQSPGVSVIISNGDY